MDALYWLVMLVSVDSSHIAAAAPIDSFTQCIAIAKADPSVRCMRTGLLEMTLDASECTPIETSHATVNYICRKGF